LTNGVPPPPDRLREFARRYTEAWCSQDPPRVAEHYAADASLTINDGAPSVGRAAITEVARTFMVAFPDLQVLMDDLLTHGNKAEYRWTLVGTNTGPGGTGRRVRISGFEEWSIGDDGLIAASLGHYDEAEYERQLQQGAEEPQE
jgi:nuclear transport factor 2 (NTF2) superfamily protein